jgi:hypothetical protein
MSGWEGVWTPAPSFGPVLRPCCSTGVIARCAGALRPPRSGGPVHEQRAPLGALTGESVIAAEARVRIPFADEASAASSERLGSARVVALAPTGELHPVRATRPIRIPGTTTLHIARPLPPAISASGDPPERRSHDAVWLLRQAAGHTRRRTAPVSRGRGENAKRESGAGPARRRLRPLPPSQCPTWRGLCESVGRHRGPDGRAISSIAPASR